MSIHNDSLDTQTRNYAVRELERISNEVLKKQLPVRNAFEAIPQDTSVSRTTEKHTEKMWEGEGEAAVLNDKTQDGPEVSVSQEEASYPIKEFGISYSYSNKDILRSRETPGAQLDEMKAETAMEGMEKTLNDVQFFGDTRLGLFGFLNNPWIGRTALGHKIEEATSVSDMLDMLHSFVEEPMIATKGLMEPNVLALPIKQYAHISRRRIPDTDTTVLDFFLDKRDDIDRVEKWHELSGAGPNGEDLASVYSDRERVVRHLFAQEYTENPPEQRAYSFKVNALAATGGVATRMPAGARIGEFPL